MESSASRTRSDPERPLVGQPDPSARDLPHQSPRELDGGQLPPLATSSQNGDEAPREGCGDRCLQLELQERVAQVRKASTTRLIGAAQTDVLLVLRTIGLASAARAPPTEAQLGLASSLLDELTRELARKRSYSDHRAAGRKRRQRGSTLAQLHNARHRVGGDQAEADARSGPRIISWRPCTFDGPRHPQALSKYAAHRDGSGGTPVLHLSATSPSPPPDRRWLRATRVRTRLQKQKSPGPIF